LSKEDWINWGSRAVWNIASVRSNDDHVAKFPIELPMRLIQLFAEHDDTVLDCFIGSGTTAAAAIIEGRNYIGIEKERQYVQLANQTCYNAFCNKVTIESTRSTQTSTVPQMELI